MKRDKEDKKEREGRVLCDKEEREGAIRVIAGTAGERCLLFTSGS